MKIPMYILGILKRYGPQHGYQIKKIFSEQISDFTQIKLPVIYYHLEKMKSKGLLSSTIDSDKAEKTIYSITNKGKKEFIAHLESTCSFKYKPEFLNDAVFFFMDSLNKNKIGVDLEQYIEKLKKDIQTLKEHKSFTVCHLSGDAKNMSEHIFNHHEYHYNAELQWAKEVLFKFRLNKTKEP
ncbi:MAG: PadR family transcriptional regulator [Bacteroidales bacterium]|nr:PadR family transcriptional regulator [Bacteroidales bacterium]MBN2819932.1 PadR family transcriptional regulator [Bacteroidales bacterium]